VIEVGLFGRAVHALVEDAPAARATFPALLAARGIALRGIEEIAPSLEDVFVARIQAEGGAPVD
jgi:ABC-2 type transport system ATP-binding protein